MKQKTTKRRNSVVSPSRGYQSPRKRQRSSVSPKQKVTFSQALDEVQTSPLKLCSTAFSPGLRRSKTIRQKQQDKNNSPTKSSASPTQNKKRSPKRGSPRMVPSKQVSSISHRQNILNVKPISFPLQRLRTTQFSVKGGRID